MVSVVLDEIVCDGDGVYDLKKLVDAFYSSWKKNVLSLRIISKTTTVYQSFTLTHKLIDNSLYTDRWS